MSPMNIAIIKRVFVELDLAFAVQDTTVFYEVLEIRQFTLLKNNICRYLQIMYLFFFRFH